MEEYQGIVLRITPYKDQDAIVLALTEKGYLSFKARGVMKLQSKNAASVSLYSYSKWELEATKNGQLALKSGQLLNSIMLHSTDLSVLLSLDAIGELLLKVLIDNEESIYPYLSTIFDLLYKKSITPLTALAILSAQVINLCGYAPFLDGCVICHNKKHIVSFTLKDGGFVCQKHFDPFNNKNQTASYLKTMRILFNLPVSYIGELALSDNNLIPFLYEVSDFLKESLGFYWKGLQLFLKSL